MRRLSSILIALTFLGGFFVVVTPAHATVPLTLPFQGRVLLKDGNPVPDGSYPAVFRLYRQDSGGVPVWSEVHEGVVAVRGVVAATLGLKTSLAPVDFAAGEYFLGVEFNNDGEMAPRARLTSLPSALASLTLEGRRASEFLLKKGNQTFEGNLTLSSGSSLTTTGTISGGNFLQGGVALDDRYLALTGGSLTGDLTLQGSGTDLSVGGTTTFTGVATFKATPVFEAGVTLPSNVTVSTLTATGTIESQGLLTAKNGFTLQAGTLSLPPSSVTDAMVSDTITASNYLALTGGTLTGTLRVDAGIGIGIAAASDRGVNITKSIQSSTYSGISTALTDFRAQRPCDPRVSCSVFGIYNLITTNTVQGGTNATGYGVYTEGTSNNAANVNYGYAFFTGSGSVGTHYAFNGNLINGTATKWGLFVQGASAGNYLANALRIGGTAATPSGNLDVRQIANGNDIIFARRNTDSGPTGNFLHYQDSTGANAALVSIVGGLTGASLNLSSGALVGGAAAITANTGIPLSVGNSTGANSIFVAQDNGTAVFTVLDGGNVQLGAGLTLGTVGGGTIAFQRTNASGTATINFNQANTIYNYKTSTRNLVLSAKDCEASAGIPTNPPVPPLGDFPTWLLRGGGTFADAIRCTFRAPADWSTGTLSMRVIHAGTATVASGSCGTNGQEVLQIQSVPVANETSATAAGTTTSETFCSLDGSGNYTANTRLTTSGITATGAVADDIVSLELTRVDANAADTYGGDTNVVQIIIQYTSSTPMSG